MKKADIIEAVRVHTALTDDEANRFFALLDHRKVPKNKLIVRAGQTDCPLILIKNGCLMTFFEDERQMQHVIQFGRKMWWTGDLNSITYAEASSYSVKAMTDSEVYLLPAKNYYELLESVPAFEKYFRSVFQNSLVSHQKRIIRNISYTAEQKYMAFRETYPGLEQVVPQKYVASFLGITPEFLSTLRKRIHRRKEG
jgi:CRP-like cAMP-binding protein